jgi:hypothetical protein
MRAGAAVRAPRPLSCARIPSLSRQVSRDFSQRPQIQVTQLDLTEQETTALLKELDDIIESDRYFLSRRIQTLKATRSKIRPEPALEPLPPPKR